MSRVLVSCAKSVARRIKRAIASERLTGEWDVAPEFVATEEGSALARFLEAMTPAELRELTVVVFYSGLLELPGPEEGGQEWKAWCPLEKRTHEDDPALTAKPVAGRLMLTFPEVRWEFEASPGDGDCLSEIRRIKSFLKSVSLSACPALFDPTGRRRALKDLVSTSMGNGHLSESAVAVVADEESAFAYIESYAAYRKGYRVWMLPSWKVMKGLLAREDPPGRLVLSFEDLDLRFPDQLEGSTEPDLSDLKLRDSLCPRLEAVEKRILVTAGHGTGTDGQQRRQKNAAYLGEKGQRSRFIYKPVSGLSRLDRAIGPVPDAGAALPGRGPSKDAAAGRTVRAESHHSAPGLVLATVDALLARARRILEDAGTTVDAVHAAVLAREGRDLLGGMTPTVALEALSLQHEAEVVAESLFLGVEYNLEVGARFEDIRREVESIHVRLEANRRTRANLNARLAIGERLASRFRALNQIEEEMAALSEARLLRFEAFVREKPLRWLLYPFLRYLAWSLSSLTRFVGAVAIQILVAAAAFAFVRWGTDLSVSKALEALAASTYYLCSNQLPPDGWQSAALCHPAYMPGLMAAFSVTSTINLGLLISHLYMLVSRR